MRHSACGKMLQQVAASRCCAFTHNDRGLACNQQPTTNRPTTCFCAMPLDLILA